MEIPFLVQFFGMHEFVLSFNDKPYEDGRTYEQKLESAGFDKKISFRKM